MIENNSIHQNGKAGWEQVPLFQEKRTWHHFIGKQYSVKQFVREAGQHGITRRVSPQQARGMNFGDEVIFCRWHDKSEGATAFARGIITGITLDEETAKLVAAEFVGEIQQAINTGAVSRSVERVCGEYQEVFTIHIHASMGDIVAAALQKAEEMGVKPFMMIRARLVEQFPPITLPGQKFSRGFSLQRSEYQKPVQTPAELSGIRGYRTA